ncbi:MAG TPA: GNAT family N-acetyltransferase [Chitinophagaceae bacterium]|nr:GNAT family N-acetyltransferase [Chitinophagaceae bacterium]
MIVFETERLIVRHYTEDDKDNFFLINGDEEIMRYIRKPKTREECDQFLDGILAGYTGATEQGRWAAEEKYTGKFVGSFVIIPIPEQPEKIQLGYALLKDHWGKGYATELTKAGLHFAFDQLGLEIIYGVTEVPNVSSQKVLLKSGFKEASTFVENEKALLLFSINKTDWVFTGSK